MDNFGQKYFENFVQKYLENFGQKYFENFGQKCLDDFWKNIWILFYKVIKIPANLVSAMSERLSWQWWQNYLDREGQKY